MKQTRLILAAMGLMALSFPANAGIVTFTLFPSNGIIGGQAGTAVGWSYTITNSGNDYVTIQSITFNEASPIGIFSTPGIPGTAATAGTDILSGGWFENVSGLQYDISASALLGASTQGLMTLFYDVYSDADLTNQIFPAVDAPPFSVNATMLNADHQPVGDVMAQVDVNQEAAPTTNEVPEPGSVGLMGIGCAALGVWRRRRVS